MIDIHSHILFGLDDGAGTLEESVDMCQIAFNDGIRMVVATPHTLNGVYENSRSTILAKVEELNTLIHEKLPLPSPVESTSGQTADPGTNLHSAGHIDLKIVPGADVHFSEKILSQIYENQIMTLGDGGKFLLVEFPSGGIPYQAETLLFGLLVRGITPVITHPERNLEIVHQPRRYIRMVQTGCFGQISAMSLLGEFGSQVKQTAETLLRKNLVHFIASDGHSANGRPPVLSSAVRAAAKIVGKEEAGKMVTEYPRAIMEGRRPDVPEPKE